MLFENIAEGNSIKPAEVQGGITKLHHSSNGKKRHYSKAALERLLKTCEDTVHPTVRASV